MTPQKPPTLTAVLYALQTPTIQTLCKRLLSTPQFLDPFTTYRDTYLLHPRSTARRRPKKASPHPPKPLIKLLPAIRREVEGRAAKLRPLAPAADETAHTVRLFSSLVRRLEGERGGWYYEKRLDGDGVSMQDIVCVEMGLLVEFLKDAYAKWWRGEEGSEEGVRIVELIEVLRPSVWRKGRDGDGDGSGGDSDEEEVEDEEEVLMMSRKREELEGESSDEFEPSESDTEKEDGEDDEEEEKEVRKSIDNKSDLNVDMQPPDKKQKRHSKQPPPQRRYNKNPINAIHVPSLPAKPYHSSQPHPTPPKPLVHAHQTYNNHPLNHPRPPQNMPPYFHNPNPFLACQPPPPPPPPTTSARPPHQHHQPQTPHHQTHPILPTPLPSLTMPLSNMLPPPHHPRHNRTLPPPISTANASSTANGVLGKRRYPFDVAFPSLAQGGGGDGGGRERMTLPHRHLFGGGGGGLW